MAIADTLVKKFKGGYAMLPDLEKLIVKNHSIFKEEYLESKINRYKRGSISLESLINTLSLVVYRYPKVFWGMDEDESSDFYLYFFPRIKRLVFRYENSGSSFKSYLYSVMRYQLRVFVKRKKFMELKDDFHKNEAINDLKINYSGKDYASPDGLKDVIDFFPGIQFQIDKNGVITDPVIRKHFLFFVLKSWNKLPDESLGLIATMVKLKKGSLLEFLGKIRIEMSGNFDKQEILRSRRNNAFCKLNVLERKLERCITVKEKEELRFEMERAKLTMRRAQKSLAKIKVSPSNRVIAEVLGLPKGTIDSGLFSLRKKIDRMSSCEDRKYA